MTRRKGGEADGENVLPQSPGTAASACCDSLLFGGNTGVELFIGSKQGGTDGRDLLVVVRLSRFLVRSWGTTSKFEFLAGNSNY